MWTARESSVVDRDGFGSVTTKGDLPDSPGVNATLDQGASSSSSNAASSGEMLLESAPSDNDDARPEDLSLLSTPIPALSSEGSQHSTKSSWVRNRRAKSSPSSPQKTSRSTPKSLSPQLLNDVSRQSIVCDFEVGGVE